MIKLKSLNLKYGELDQKIKSLEARQNRLYHRCLKQKALMLEDSFKEFSHNDYQLKFSETRVSLHPNGDKYNDLIEYTLETRWRRDDRNERIEKSKLYHNGKYHYNNGEEDSNFDEAIAQSEARLYFIRMATANDENIKFRWEAIDAKYSKYDVSYYSPLRKLRDEHSEVSSNISKLEEQAEMNKLEDKKGISFQSTEKNSLPGLDVRFDWRIGSIKNLRVVGKTETGKSVDLQITRAADRWNEELDKLVKTDKVEVFAKVRFDNVKKLLRNARYNNQII